ncbi:hypothetical protein J8I26_04165 [Herbaspirillum sp. LeCh32-8]|uniref:hypothetical protein n=1 Tax=Herbaspirillum sp. LeCh32-8 TaxID=2821356 RepID=UPI001AE7B333|nr:hypothetical protein [Herbaspirillum sp. LeCh32-8]MBP0597285.1 hypothetical protein [Herbaspirillum sp. LeCh32-8]
MTTLNPPGLHQATSIQSFQTYNSSASSSTQGPAAPKTLHVSLEEFAKMQPGQNVNHRIIIGAGPRGTAQVIEDLQFMLKNRADFEKLMGQGAEYNIQTTLIDRKSKEYVARGNGWGPDQGVGTVNTSPEAAQDHKNRLAKMYKANRDELSAKYAEQNPIAHSALNTAFKAPEGSADNPTTGRAALTRADQGKEEQDFFNALCEEAHAAFPFLKINVITEASVDRIDVSDPANPKVLVKSKANPSSSVALGARGVVINTGTTVKNPISDPEVLKHTFAQPMNPEHLNEFLAQKQLLDEHGELKQGAKLLVGGTGLSLYDQLIALHGSMKLMEVDESSPFGYKLTDEAKAKYQDALTVVSFTAGKWISPRHTNTPQWTQAQPPLVSPEELHAAFLHEDGQEVYRSYASLAIASVARTLGLTPEQVHQNGLTTEALLTEQGASTRQHIDKLVEASSLTGPAREQAVKEATWTLEGARRQAYLSMILGFGMTENPTETIQHMAELAPLTFKGRDGYLMERAQPAGVTTAEVAEGRGNKSEMDVLTTLTNDITASPFRVHYFAVMLAEAGILKYQQGSYNAFKAEPGDSQISFQGKQMKEPAKFDAFVVSPTFDRKAEKVLDSLSGKVESIHPDHPDLPALSGNRLMTSTKEYEDGKVLLPIQDLSLNGLGVALGNRSKVGLVAYDVNNRDSAYDVSPGMTLRRMAQEHLYAVGLSGAAFEEVEKLYAKHSAVDRKTFDAEVAQFSDAFDSSQHKAAFANAVDKAIREDATVLNKGDTFGVLANLFASSKLGAQAAGVVAKHMDANRELFGVDGDDRMRTFVTAGVDYAAQKPAKFNPASPEKLFARSIDYPLHVHQAVYKDALAFAEGRLTEPKVRRRDNFPTRNETSVSEA